MMNIAIDVETTGLEPGSRLVELAAVAFDESGAKSQFSELIDPEMPMPDDTTEKNGITQSMLIGKRKTDLVLSDFFSWAKEYEEPLLIAHWAQFDTGMIAWSSERAGIKVPQYPVVCTCLMAKAEGATPNNKLVTLEEHYGLQREGDIHRALSDADVCRQYFQLMRFGDKPAPMNSIQWDKAGHDYAYTTQFPTALSELPDLIASGESLSFKYRDAEGKKTDRTITPYGWASVKGKLMFHGHCHLRKERRSFYAERMEV
jgi:DNA polymerase III epsilon subunit-like protein